MAHQLRKVRVFISSTFRDMHAERDHLVRVVFPELKKLCRENQVQLTDVDLRWGVSESDAQDGKALDICLNEIDTCRPYFLGLLGHRYGWVPPGESRSITAAEIYHGVLHNDLPEQVVDLRGIIEGRLEGRRLSDEQANCLRACYPWDGQKRKYILRANLSEADATIIREVFSAYAAYQRDRSFFFMRSECLSRELAGNKQADFFESDPVLQTRLKELKEEITAPEVGLRNFEYDDLEAFGNQVRDVLWQRILAELGDEPAIERDPLEVERDLHDIFAADRTRRFVGRRAYLDTMHRFCEAPEQGSLLVVTGEPGCGKSALMARFAEEIGHAHPDWLIIPHFVGASPDSTNLRRSLRRFYGEINRRLGLDEEIPEDIRDLQGRFPDKLKQAAEASRVLFIVDAVNQMERADNPQDMTWLPANLPANVCWVVSTLDGQALDALQARQPQVVEARGLDAHEIQMLVDEYLSEVGKGNFPKPADHADFLAKVSPGSPLYIMVALEELRVFGGFEELGKRIADLPADVPALFQQVLARVENDFAAWPGLVSDALSLVACSRQGMTPEELQALLASHAPALADGSRPERLPNMIWSRLRLSLDAYLFERSGAVDFFHGQLKEAVGARYQRNEADRDRWHQIIADYLERRWAEPYLRAVDELPHQLIKAKDWPGVERVLCDLLFVQEKCAAKQVYELNDDYRVALEALPENQENIRRERERHARLDKWAKDLVAYARGEIKELEIIPSVEPRREAWFDAEMQRIAKKPTRLDRLKCFANFVQGQSHNFIKYGSESEFCLRQAYNHAACGPVEQAAASIIEKAGKPCLLLGHPNWRPAFNPHPACLRTLEGHLWYVTCVAITPNGRLAVSASEDKTLRVWNLKNGHCLRTLAGHSDSVNGVALTPDGRLAVSASSDNTLRVWELESRRCLRTLEGHSEKVLCVALTPDGRLAVSGSADNTLRVWELESGQCLRTLEGHSYWVRGVALTSDGRLAVSASWDSTLRVWDLASGQCVNTLRGHGDQQVHGMALSSDDRLAISLCRSGYLRVWDLASGQCLTTFNPDVRGGLEGVALTADASLVATGGFWDKTLRIWDLASGQCLRSLEGHSDSVNCVAVTADACLAVSASNDKTLRVWDLTSGQSLSSSIDKINPLASHRDLRVVQVHTAPVNCVDLTPDGSLAVSASEDGTLLMWDLASGECLGKPCATAPPIKGVALSADGRRLVSGGGWGHGLSDTFVALRVQDLVSGNDPRTLKGHSGMVLCVALTPDGRLAVSGSLDDTLRVWDLASGSCLRTLGGQFLEGHRGAILEIALTPDGRLAVSASNDYTLRVWDLDSGKCLKTLKGHSGGVSGVALTADGRLAISASMDKILRVWDLTSGQCLRTLEGHLDWVTGVALTSDVRLAVSSSHDSTLRVWDLASGQCLAVAELEAMVVSLALRGDTVVAGLGSGHIAVFRLYGQAGKQVSPILDQASNVSRPGFPGDHFS